jgi:GT2 family glycosyltransferase
LTTIVVVAWRSAAFIGDCLDGIATQTRSARVLVVDNASTDGTAALLRGHRVIRLPRNVGFAGGVAAALAVVDTPYVALLNDDAVPEPNWLAELEKALTPDIAAVAGCLVATDGGVQSYGTGIDAHGYGYDVVDPGAEVLGFCGGSALLRRSALWQHPIATEFFCYYEDLDLSWRLRRAGWRIVSAPAARATHRHGASTEPGSADFHRWNERNRLLTLLRNAPAGFFLVELLRFVTLTVVVAVRRAKGTPGTQARNFSPKVRIHALLGVARWAGRALTVRWSRPHR